MSLHLHNIEFKKIELSVPREGVNNFLSSLWDDFNKTIGRVSCQHSYLNTKDSEIYKYNISWSDRDSPFIAKLSFYNHTAKGLIYVLVAVVDYETKKPNDDFQKKIIESIKRT